MLCVLNVGTVPMLCILYVGTVPTFSHSLLGIVLLLLLLLILENFGQNWAKLGQ